MPGRIRLECVADFTGIGREYISKVFMVTPAKFHFALVRVTDRPKGATDDRVNGATQSGSFSLLDGVNYWSFFALFSFVVFVPWGQFFGER